jgi:hypothetical protein
LCGHGRGTQAGGSLKNCSLSYGDRGFESIPLQRRICCEPDDHAGLSQCGRIQWRNIVRVVFTRAARLDCSVREASLLDILDRLCLRRLQRACRIAGGDRETQLRGFTNRGVSRYICSRVTRKAPTP